MQSSLKPEAVEILSVELLDRHRPVVNQIHQLAGSLGIGLGWHYLLDWVWILDRLGSVSGKRILDAGAGEGLLQWYLAERGAQVISVDRADRVELSLRYRARYHVSAMRPGDLAPAAQVLRRNLRLASSLPQKGLTAVRGMGGMIKSAFPKKAPGRVVIYHEDLRRLALVPDKSLDAVVAVSALEHNTPENLEIVVKELMRTLKPGGLLLATLGAAKEKDWFHQPSQGWCYTEATLKQIFDLDAQVPSNYDRHDELFERLVGCAELRDNLAPFYAESGDNGMPWGKWDPQYQPVGVCKQKSAR